MRAVRVAVVVGAVASVASAQFNVLSWELEQHGGGSASLSPTAMQLHGAQTSGSNLAYIAHAPFAMRVHSQMDFDSWDSTPWTSAPLSVVGPAITELANFTMWRPVTFDVPAFSEFGFGLLQKSGADGLVFFGNFTPTPLPTTVVGASPGDGLGAALATVGDVNGDGVTDLVAGMPGHSSAGPASGGALLISGADGAVLMTFHGDAAGDHFGAAVGGAGDVDGDGTPDVIVGAPHTAAAGALAGAARVLSGSDGTVLYTFLGSAPGDEFGSAVSGVGDVNGDGHADLCVGAPHADVAGSSSGAAVVLSGADGARLHTFVGGQAGALAGTAVGTIGDLSRDGYDDVVVSAPGEGAVWIYSGVDGAPVYGLAGAQAAWKFGASLAAAGDLDGDGTTDLLVGEPGHIHGFVHVFSGATGVQLMETTIVSADELGSSVAGASDLDGDGVRDFIAGDPKGNSSYFQDFGQVLAFSGRDGSYLFSLGGIAEGDASGTAIADLGDRDGDGIGEVAIGVPGLDDAATDAGGVVLQDFFANWFDLGQGLAGSLGMPKLKGVGFLVEDTPVTVTLTNAKKLVPAALVIGLSQLGAPLKGGVLVPNPDVLISGLSTGSTGGFALTSTWPDGIPSGFEFLLQAWLPDPAAAQGFAASNGLRARAP